MTSLLKSDERKRLYKEAKTFLKVRSMRNKLVKEKARNASRNGNGHSSNGSGVEAEAEPSPQETVQV